MKPAVCVLFLLLGASTMMAGPEQIIKQRAKDIRDQNNARQGVPPAAPAPAARPTPVISAMPAQPPLTRLTTDLVNIKTNSTVTQAQIQSFSRNLATAAQGTRKPSSVTLNKLATDLLPALASHPLSANGRTRLLQNLMALVNGNGITSGQVNDVVVDIQEVLKKAGVPADTAKAISDDARAIAREVHG
jgi:hypothetical protein